MKCYLSWSGGKDSTASLILCHEKEIPLDGVIFSEVMFSHERNISGEDPVHIKWVYETAIPIIEKMGYPVKVVKDKEDYLSLFHHRITKSKVPERIGKKSGWLIGGMCTANSRLKVRPLREFFKSVGECEQVLGIAKDEPERLLRLKKNCWSILDREGVYEADTYDICASYNLLSPIYDEANRGGCWFCPNNSIKDFGRLAKRYPELWAELEKLSYTENLFFQGFKYGRTFESVNREVQLINRQISFFD